MSRSRIRTTLLGTAVAALSIGALAACGADGPTVTINASADTTPPAATSRPTGQVDVLVTVRGARMHLHCEGHGSTTVMLIAGFGDGGDNWGDLPASLDDEARVCSYARYGTGTSDPAPSDQTFTTEAADLQSLLDATGETGPYVLVGHSYGGPEAVTFASHYPEEVDGLLLIDASPTTWLDGMCSVTDDGTEMADMLQANCADQSDPAANPERLDGPTAFAELSRIDSLHDLPMIVITAVDRDLPGLGTAETARLTKIWDAGQARWAGLSTASQVVPVDDVSHYLHLDRPEIVLDLVRQLLD